MTEFPGYLTIGQAATRLGVHRSTVWRAIERGALTPFRSARNARVRLVNVTEIEAIERVTQERDRKRID